MPVNTARKAAVRASTSWPTWKRMVWTGAFAAVTFVGTIYGAGLKTQQEWKTERQRIQEVTMDEKMAALEQRRAHLMKQKTQLELKLDDLHSRMRERGEQQQ
ncbi:hypothetical protein QBC46DRAFT_252945 [Diplogelasinospora grovesii]|uniref:Uncharacterized protein n=1 Tax=Diplogelasinospora grovesii TaxID=303347 RepID=A0AAN6NH22_9PEZI|nr:hypothetical protein QBC46DRAFT_252945 [Diplogelasinospora grovesii]